MENQLNLFEIKESLAPTSFELHLREYLPKFSDSHECIAWLYERMGPKERTYATLLQILDGQEAYYLARRIKKSYPHTLRCLQDLERLGLIDHSIHLDGSTGRPPRLWKCCPIP